MKIGLGLLLIVIGFAAYVRLAPNRSDVWHVSPPELGPGDHQGAGSFTAVRVLAADWEDAIQRLDAIILATPRTQRLAGSVEARRVTYITRSRVFGFPDYTTLELQPGAGMRAPMMTIHARLRYGVSDMGVNKARVSGWLTAADL